MNQSSKLQYLVITLFCLAAGVSEITLGQIRVLIGGLEQGKLQKEAGQLAGYQLVFVTRSDLAYVESNRSGESPRISYQCNADEIFDGIWSWAVRDNGKAISQGIEVKKSLAVDKIIGTLEHALKGQPIPDLNEQPSISPKKLKAQDFFDRPSDLMRRFGVPKELVRDQSYYSDLTYSSRRFSRRKMLARWHIGDYKIEAELEAPNEVVDRVDFLPQDPNLPLSTVLKDLKLKAKVDAALPIAEGVLFWPNFKFRTGLLTYRYRLSWFSDERKLRIEEADRY